MKKSICLFLLIALFAVSSGSNCNSTPANPNEGVNVIVSVRLMANGANPTDESTRDDDGTVGLNRQLNITVVPRSNTQLLPNNEGVKVAFLFEGHPPGQTEAAIRVPNSSPARFIFNLYGTKDLRACEKMNFTVAVSYRNTRLNQDGVFLGQEKTIMPDKEILGPTSIAHHDCVQ